MTTPRGPEPLSNPEREWAPRLRTSVDVSEIERCLGQSVTDFSVLSGGLANTSVRVGSRVLRLYRRDPRAARLEAALLGQPWRSLRVPAVLDAGAGFLVLEHVAHGPLLGTEEHGAAVGHALAEVHAVTFAEAGFLAEVDGAPRVVTRFPDLVGALLDHARSQLEDDACALSPSLRARTLHALVAAAPALRGVAGRHVLVHADFKVSNLHWASDGRPLVLDWEFAYAGAALSDVGQLMRWEPPAPFVEAFAASYRAHGGQLVDDWKRRAATLDLVNLAGLVVGLSAPGDGTTRRIADVARRVEQTLAIVG